MRIAECNARTHEDVRLHAEKAAFEGQTLRPFFNSLQARTVHKLSPETRLFAEVFYENKLAYCVASALIECAKSEIGREKAIEILRTAQSTNIRSTWKPLVDHCSLLLRGLKLEATNARLSRLNDIWTNNEHGDEQSMRMRKVVHVAIWQSFEQAQQSLREILDWVELYSISNCSAQVARPFVKNNRTEKKRLIVVDTSETFSEAEVFLLREVERGCLIHVIVGNEDDGARFYMKIHDRFSSNGVQLIWREKAYGSHYPHIVIGSIEHFASKFFGNGEHSNASAVFLHAEQNLEKSFVNRFEPGNLDDYLAELYILTTVTMKHYHELGKHHGSDDILKTLDSWPTANQVLDKTLVLNLWNKLYHIYGHSELCNKKFMDHLLAYTSKLIKGKIKQFRVPHNLEEFVDRNCSKFVQSAYVARACELGQDYIVYAARSSGALTLRVRLKQQLNPDFGLLQFLELRHGCAMTPYIVPKELVSASQWIQNYDHVLVINRSNVFRNSIALEVDAIITRQAPKKPMYYSWTITNFPSMVTTEVKNLNGYLVVVVCCTKSLMDVTFDSLKEENVGSVCISETSLGISNESMKNPNGTLIICTTSVCFEGWKFVPRVRKNLRIIVCHHEMDTAAMEVACDLAHVLEITSFQVNNDDMERLKELKKGRESTKSLLKQTYEKARSIFTGCSASEPVDAIKNFLKDGDINELLEEKRSLHWRMRHISKTAKMVYAQLPVKLLESVDSPMDIACQGFLDQSRMKMRDAITMLREVEILLSSHPLNNGVVDAMSDKKAIDNIAKKYLISKNILHSFVHPFRSMKLRWTDLRAKVEREYIIMHDAEEHWELCYKDDTRPREDYRVVALSSECVSAATNFLLNLKLIPCPENFRQKFHNLSSITTLLDEIAEESVANDWPLYLFPRRCYDRLTRDIFDSGLVLCDDYSAADKQMHEYDLIRLPIIFNTTPPSKKERLLKMESALMEYGSKEWMEWLARRLRYSDYKPELVKAEICSHRFQVTQFYHRIVAEIDYCVQDERLIRRLRDALTERSGRLAVTSTDKIRMDAFVYSTMDILQRGERLVIIEPPFTSNEALQQLSHFIRSRRMPPP